MKFGFNLCLKLLNYIKKIKLKKEIKNFKNFTIVIKIRNDKQ